MTCKNSSTGRVPGHEHLDSSINFSDFEADPPESHVTRDRSSVLWLRSAQKSGSFKLDEVENPLRSIQNMVSE